MSPWAAKFQEAARLARRGQFEQAAALCTTISSENIGNMEALLDAGSLLFSCGYLSSAARLFSRARNIAPGDYRPLVNLANIASQQARHHETRRVYEALLRALPDDPLVRRNALTSIEYDHQASDRQRLAMARQWGDWAVARAGGHLARPASTALNDRALRVGYLSPDFCQHTVGLFAKDILASHDSSQVEAFAYSAGFISDGVTKAIQSSVHFRDVSAMDDVALAERIRDDDIDVLVELAGHTGGSRLTACALRPAPVMLSWLGYFATTGLGSMDGVLLDKWHAPPGMQDNFIEQIICLPQGRLCYSPQPFAPEVVGPPLERNNYVTFGCFNNTSKLNDSVLALWGRILNAVPNSRLILKWHSFNDPEFRNRILARFTRLGISPERIELRGPSFHVELLREYGDVDVALDPFPFTGGLTSCEALWMGVPVVTWPQERVVSRQTYAFLSALELDELAATDADDYVNIATELASDRLLLSELRSSLRRRMSESPLCDVLTFTRELEKSLRHIFEEITINPE